jgi:hypothetical protein
VRVKHSVKVIIKVDLKEIESQSEGQRNGTSGWLLCTS